jgi:hypothetical protein
MVRFGSDRWTGGHPTKKERVMSVRSRRLTVAAVIAATAIALPAAALASVSGTPSGKPAPSATASQPTGTKSAPPNQPTAGGAAAASKAAAAQQSGTPDSVIMSAEVAALASQLGVSQSAAQHALDQLEALSRGGVDPASPAFTMIARDLGVSPDQLAGALGAVKQAARQAASQGGS